MSLTPGTRLGPYEIVAPLGAGGMGEVYRARDTRLGRDVAVKALPEAFAQDPERLARFEREAKLLASLNHTNVAGIYGVEEGQGTRFLVLEFVDGETLAARIARGALPINDAIEIALQIAAGVEAAHEAGVVHRDLKPGNVMITAGDHVKVLDFGLARTGGTERGGSDPNLTSSPTRTYNATQAGIVLGTAAYMSPEQARGKSVDRRTDIWSFGCVLFECLTGKPLFDGETVSDLIAKILQTEPDWSALPAETPARLRALLKRCLRRDPKERVRDIGDARIELSEILAGSGTDAASSPTAATRSLSGVWKWIALAAGLVAVASASMLVTKKPAPAPLVRLDLMSPDPAFPIQTLGNFAIAPDGHAVAFVLGRGTDVPHIMVRALDNATPRALEGTNGAVYPFWSPDSKHIGFFAEGKLRRIPAAGGVVQTLCDVPSPRGGSWGDGVIVFAPEAVSGLYRVADTGGTPVAATALDSTRSEASHRFPCFFPDGKRFLFGAQSSGADRQQGMRIGSLTEKSVKMLPVPSLSAMFAPPDRVLFIQNGTLMSLRLDMKTLEPRGAPVALGTDCNTTPRVQGSPVASASHNGVLVLGSGYNQPTVVAWYYPDGRVEKVVQDDARLSASSLSSDLRHATLVQTAGGFFTTYVLDLTDGSILRVGKSERGLRTALWDPAGNRIAGVLINAGRSELRLWDLSTGADSLLVEAGHEWGVTTDWSQAANVILFSALVEGRGLDCRYVTLTGKRKMVEYLATPANEGAGAISPDGKWIAYWSDAAGTLDLVVDSFPVASGSRRVPTGPTSSGQSLWSNNLWWDEKGNAIMYRRDDSPDVKILDVRTQPTLELGNPRTFMRAPDELYSMIWDEKNRRFLVSQPGGTPRASLIVIQNWQRLLAEAN